MDYQEEYNQMMKTDTRPSNSSQDIFRYIIIAVIAFVLGFGAAWVSFKNQDGAVAGGENNMEEDDGKVDSPAVVSNNNNGGTNTGSNSENNNNEEPEVVSIGNVSLSVNDQAPGQAVFVEEVSAEKPVWVVIIENNNGVRGNVIGAGLFDVGETAGAVNLLRGTVPGGHYYAALYNEDSDLTEGRVFELENDVALVDLDGNPIEVEFTTTSAPAE